KEIVQTYNKIHLYLSFGSMGYSFSASQIKEIGDFTRAVEKVEDELTEIAKSSSQASNTLKLKNRLNEEITSFKGSDWKSVNTTSTAVQGFTKYPNIRKSLSEVQSILQSKSIDVNQF